MTLAEAATYDTWREIAHGSVGSGVRCYDGIGQPEGRFNRYVLVPRAIRCKTGKEIWQAMETHLVPDGTVTVIDGAEAVEFDGAEFREALAPDRLAQIMRAADEAHRERNETGGLIADVLRAVEEMRTDKELAVVREELKSPAVA